MHNQNNNLITNYGIHPNFQFDSQSMEITDLVLKDFEVAYMRLSKQSSETSSKQKDDLNRDVTQSLNALFDELKNQVKDDYETQFLSELLFECQRVLQEQSLYFCSRRHVTVQKNIALQNEAFFFDELPESAIAEIQVIAKESMAALRLKAAAGHTKRSDLSVADGDAIRAIAKCLNRVFDSNGVNDALSAHTGQQMNVDGLALELSVPQSVWWKNSFDNLPRAPKTLYAHLDESISIPKSIMYLTDVDEDSGPTSCYPGLYANLGLNPLQDLIGRVIGNIGSSDLLSKLYNKKYHQSMNSIEFRRHFMRLPDVVRFNSHFGWDVMPNSELEFTMVKCEKAMLGKAGTYIVFDGGKLVHRGGLIKSQDRVALQIIFSKKISFMQKIIRKIIKL